MLWVIFRQILQQRTAVIAQTRKIGKKSFGIKREHQFTAEGRIHEIIALKT